MIDHSGHRGRLRKRYLATAGKGFEPHNLLELLLFYAIPRRDTTETAHALLKRFGSVSGVLEASVEELCRVDGINESAAVLIKVVGTLSEDCVVNKTNSDTRFYTFDDIANHMRLQFVTARDERFVAFFMDSSGQLLKAEIINEGSINSANVNVRRIVTRAMELNASAVAVGHNHPGGVAMPSSSDLDTTKLIKNLLDVAGIELIEHFIVADDGVCRVLENSSQRPKSGIKGYFVFDEDEG